MSLVQRVSPNLAARIATRLFTFPRRFRRPQRETDHLQSARPAKMNCGRGLVATWTWGRGPRSVLLTHGWEGRGGQLGALAAPLVEAGYKVVAFDAPGHGESFGYQSNLVGFADTILALAAVQTHLSAVVAHSFGAAATTLALSRGLVTDRAIFLAPPARFDHYLELFSAAFGLSPQTLDAMIKRFEGELSLKWSDLNPLTQAPSMQLPLLTIHDQNDSEIPWEHSKILCEMWPEAQLITTSGLGHRRILRDPEVISEIVAFIGRDKSRPAAPSSMTEVLNRGGTSASTFACPT